jgi:hypothetical protein
MSTSRWMAACLIAACAAFVVCSAALLAAPVGSDGTDVGPPPALAPGHAPPLPKVGPLAEPRSPDQVGFPAALTKSVIPADSPLTPAVVSLGEKLFFEAQDHALAGYSSPFGRVNRISGGVAPPAPSDRCTITTSVQCLNL